MGYNKPNPLKMMESALKMYKAEKKGGMHRMESPMYAKEVSKELKDMPIVDIEKGKGKVITALIQIKILWLEKTA